MKPFAKLRGRMHEMDINSNALANFLGRSQSYVSTRMTHNSSWELDEIYKILDLLMIPPEEIFTYFPPNGVLPEKVKPAKDKRTKGKPAKCKPAKGKSAKA